MCAVLINGIGGTLLLLEMRTVLIWWLHKVESFTDLKLSVRNFSYMHYGLGFRNWLHIFLPYLEYVVKIRMVFKNPRSGLVW